MSRPQFISIFNDVIGPVMRGPSSSHTAGSFHIGATARMLLGEPPVRADFTFDRDGSYGETYRTQSADLAFATGLMDRSLTDPRFPKALDHARAAGIRISFRTGRLERCDHPNMVRIFLAVASGRTLDLLAKSTGGRSTDGSPNDCDFLMT